MDQEELSRFHKLVEKQGHFLAISTRSRELLGVQETIAKEFPNTKLGTVLARPDTVAWRRRKLGELPQ